MIKKIRSYLLDDQENSQTWTILVGIMLFSPFMFFEILKIVKPKHVAIINGCKVYRDSYRVKYEENRMIVDNISRIYGASASKEIERYFFEGKTAEEFTLEKELIKALLNGFVKKNLFKSAEITDNYLEKNISPKNAKIIQLLGMTVFNGLTKEADTVKYLNNIGITNDILDRMAEEIFIELFIKKILFLNISMVEKYFYNDQEIENAEFNVFKINKKKIKENLLNKYKNEKFFEKIENEEILKNIYFKNIEIGKYKTLQKNKFDIYVFNVDEKEQKVFLGLNASSDEDEDIELFIKKIKEKFQFKNLNSNIIIEFNEENGDVIFSNKDLTKNIAIKAINASYNNKAKAKVFFEKNKGYIFVLKNKEEVKQLGFKEAKSLVENDFIIEDLNIILKKNIENIRKNIDNVAQGIDKDLLNKDITLEKVTSKNKEQYELYLKNIKSNLKLRKGSTFKIIDNDSEVIILNIENIIYKNEDKKNKSRKINDNINKMLNDIIYLIFTKADFKQI